MSGCLEGLSNGQVMLVLVTVLGCVALLFGAGYWAGAADSRTLHRERSEPELPDPRKFTPPKR